MARSLLNHGFEECLMFSGVYDNPRLFAHAPIGGNDDDSINRPGSVCKESCVPLFGEEDDFSVGIGGT